MKSSIQQYNAALGIQSPAIDYTFEICGVNDTNISHEELKARVSGCLKGMQMSNQDTPPPRGVGGFMLGIVLATLFLFLPSVSYAAGICNPLLVIEVAESNQKAIINVNELVYLKPEKESTSIVIENEFTWIPESSKEKDMVKPATLILKNGYHVVISNYNDVYKLLAEYIKCIETNTVK